MSSRLIRSAAAAVVAMMLGQSPAFALMQNTQPAGAAHDHARPRPACRRPAPCAGRGAAGHGGRGRRQGVRQHRRGQDLGAGEAEHEGEPGGAVPHGMRSSVTCVIPPDQTFKLESLGTIRVSEAMKRGTKASTELLMKYGAASYGIQQAGLEHASTIRTPSSTLRCAARSSAWWTRPRSPRRPKASPAGALYQAAQRQTRLGGTGYAIVNSVQGTPHRRRCPTRWWTRARASRPHDLRGPLRRRPGFPRRGAVVRPAGRHPRGPRRAGPGVGRSARRLAAGPAEFRPPLVGQRRPELPRGRPADHAGQYRPRDEGGPDLERRPRRPDCPPRKPRADRHYQQPPGIHFTEILFPGFGLNLTNSGGQIPYDDRGGQRGGQEIAYWAGSFPLGLYGVGVLNVSGQPTTSRSTPSPTASPCRSTVSTPRGTSPTPQRYAAPPAPARSTPALCSCPNNPYLREQDPLVRRRHAGDRHPCPDQLDQELRQQTDGSTSNPVVTGPTAKPAAPDGDGGQPAAQRPGAVRPESDFGAGTIIFVRARPFRMPC